MRIGDPETETRITQYEMAFRMQTSVPELTDMSSEPQSTYDLYGPEAKEPGTFAANCLLARRLIDRGTRFVQIFHRGWDQHGSLPQNCPASATMSIAAATPCFATSNSAACSRTRWSSGAANLAALSIPRAS